MAEGRAAVLRRLWLNVHLWIGVGLAILLVPISISGGLLVFHDEIDAVLNPQRYAVSGPEVAQPPSAYLAQAAGALVGEPGRAAVTGLRFPQEPGKPVQAVARAQSNESGVRPRMLIVYLDPPTGAVLDVVDFRASFFGFMHVFHENLTIPQYSGRQIVGWVGCGMLVLSLTGIWLWWPRNLTSWSGLLRALRWSRSSRFTFNLHHLLGFWIAIPLAGVSLTGIYLSFPQTARTAMSAIAPMNPQGQRGGFNTAIASRTTLTADRALEIAQQAEPAGRASALFLPTEQRRNDGGERGDRSPQWRVQMSRPDSAYPVALTIDDRSGRVSTAAAPQSGDRAASWMRWIHEGSHSGPIWAFVVFLTGVFPTVFAITGITMWLRRRAGRRMRRTAAVQLRPAE